MSDIDKFLGGPSVDDFLGVQPKSSTVRRAGDLAVSAAKGVVGAGEALVGLADIPTGGRAGKFLEQKAGFRPKEAKAAIEDFYTPEQKAANTAVQGADGFVDTLAAAVQNPSTIVQAGVESLPLMFGGAAIARGVKAGSAVARAAAGEGAVGAGSAAEQIRQETETGDLTAKQAALAAVSGAATGGISLGAGKVAQKLGIADIDTLLAGGSGGAKAVGAKDIAKGIGKSVFTEGVLEELPQSTQEQALQNLALDKPIGEGVGNAAAMGLLTGGLFGAVGGAASQYGNFVDGKKTTDLKPTDPAPELQPGPEGGVVTPGGQAFQDQDTFKQAWDAASEKEREDFISGAAKAEQSIDAMTQDAFDNMQSVRDADYRRKQPKGPSIDDFAPLSPELAMERMRQSEVTAQRALEKQLLDAEVAAGQKLPDTGAISRAVNAGVDSGAVPVVNGALAAATTPEQEAQRQAQLAEQQQAQQVTQARADAATKAKDLPSAAEGSAKALLDQSRQALEAGDTEGASKLIKQGISLQKQATQLREADTPKVEAKNANQPIPDSTPAGRAQTDGVVDGGNNVPAGADVAKTSSPATAPTAEGSALPPAQQVGQTEGGATEGAQTGKDGARTVEPATKAANKAKLEKTIAKRALAKTKEEKTDTGTHYAAGMSDFKAGKPRVLPSYFTEKTGKNPKDWYRGWDAANLAAPVAESRPATKPAKPADAVLGKNAKGETVYEDDKGIRYVVDGAFKLSESVDMIPTRQGMQTARSNPDDPRYTPVVDKTDTGQNDELDAEMQAYEQGLTAETRAEDKAKLSKSAERSQTANKTENTEKTPAESTSSQTSNSIQVSKNTIFTEDAAEKARAILRKKLYGTLNSGIDPEVMQAGISLAGYHIEKGARTFAAYAKAMIEDMGEGVRPYLKSWYLGVKFDPRSGQLEGMDSAADVELSVLENIENQADTVNSEKADDTTQQPRADNGNEESSDAARTDSAADSRPLDGRLAEADAGNAEGRKPTERAPRASRPRKDSGSGQPELFSFGETREDGGVRDRPTTTGSITPQEFTISDESGIGEGGLKKKYTDNIAAIKLVKELDATNMRATPEQQAVIAKYVGWGGIKGVFDPDNKQWGKQHAELKDLLTPEEFAAARRSMLDAHYTSIDVIDGMYAGLSHIGFRGGRILEPSMGIGNFIGRMPANIRSESMVVGVELDKLTGQLARHIYPNARIATPKGFEEVRLPSDSFDLAIGNPPFGQQSVFDPEHKDLSKFSIHNFFFAKSIDKLRPGGVLSMVVSRYFMDAEESQARDWIGERAKLLGAVRLPYTAFKTNANTEVVTDIIFLQKLAEGEESNIDQWSSTKRVTMGSNADGNIDKSINAYFVDNPQNVLGTPALSGSQYSANEYNVEPLDGELPDQIKEALSRILPAQSYEQGPAIRFDEQAQADVAVPDNLKNGSFFEKDGVIYAAVPGIQTEFTGRAVDALTPLNAERIRGMIKVRDSLRTLMRAELNDLSDAQLNNLRKKLNQEYDAFKAEHGFINAQANRRAFVDDPDLPLLESLEPDYDPGLKSTSKAVRENGETARPPKAGKADIFQKRVLAPETHIKNVTSAKDALLASLNVYGKIDTDYMAQIYTKPWDTIAAELTGKVYRDPAAGWVTSEEYLSGNVKSKLAHAETLVKMDQDLKPNVEALKAVQPVDLPVTKISVRLGSSWLPNDTVKQFIQETIGGKATVHYEKSLARWFVGLEGADRTATNITFGTNRVPAEEILVKVMNSQEILVKDNVGTSRETVYVVNEVETEAAKAKADDLKNKFKNWIWADADRAETLGRFWNDNYNTNRDRVYDGSHLTLPGSNPAITLRRHQKDAIWRALSDRVILLDHVVGAGKTFMMTGIAKEMRRLGIAKKPMFAVPNHLVRSWRDEIFRLYPSANVLVATEADFEKTNRRRLFGKIATGDWDAVVIGHSSVKKIGLPVESSMKVLKEQLDELSAAIETMKRERGDKSVVKDMERIKVTLETRMKKLNDKAGKKDDVVNFEEMGIDALFVDELHEFKNLFFYTQMSRVSGLGNPSGSGKAFDMFVKFRNLVDRFGERAVRVGATGTPVSNSLVEMYNMQRYMQYDELKRRSMHLLDGWAGNYGDIEQVYEVHPSGNGFRVATRFAKFVNLTSLMQMYRSFADTITMKDLKRQATEAGQKFPVPMVKGGRPQNVVVPRSDQQTKFFGIAEFARNEDGSIKFKAKGSPSDYVFEKDAKTEKWSYRKSDSNYGKGSFEGEAQARQSLADDLTTPVTGYNKGSILDQFENLRELTRESKGKINALSITNKARKAGLDYRLIDPSAADDLGSKINDAVSQIKRIYDKWSKDKGAQLVFCDLSVPASQVAKLALKERDVYVRNGEDLKKFKATSHNIAAVESVFYVGKTKDGYIAYDAMTGNKVNGVQGEKRSDVLDQLKENAEAGGLTWLQTVQGETETLTDEAIKEWRDENETSDSDEEEEDSVSLTDVLALAGNGAKFSVYDDVKAKLIKMGVPAEQVAFIHDANTSKQKAAIFKKVNAGAIRVLLGSTPKMGAGTNVQERLVGLHHLDAPWRPSDLEQREGRIVRQGNSLYARDPEGFEVELLRYATDRTYDTRMWQIIEHKANGIEQLRNAGADVNELDDIGGEAANAADMKAAASGNPLILEEIKLRNEVKSLEAQRNGWLNEKITINRDIREITNWLPDQIEKAKAKAAPLVSVRDKNTTEEFSMKVGDTEYAERKDATKAIAESIKGLAKAVGEVSTIANYRGFKVRAQLEGKSKSVGLTVWIEYGEFQRAVLFHDLADGDVSASGLVTRIDNAVNEIGEDVPRLEQQLEASKKRLPDLRASLDKPFEKEDRLNEARVKHGDVLRRLKKSGGAVEMTPAMKREFQAAVAKVNQGLKDSGFDIPAMSRLNPAKTKEGLPAYFNEDVVLAEPRFAQTQPQTGVRYAFDIVDHPKFKSLDKSKSAEIRREIAKVGSILLTFDENGQFKTFNNIQIYNQNRGQGWGSKTVGAIMETLPPGQVLTIEDIVPTAVGFWDKMGAKFPSSDGYMEAQFTPEQYWSAYEKRIAESNAKFFDEDGTGGTPPLSRQGNGAPAKLRSQGRSSVSGLSASQVREFVGKSLNRIVAPVQIVQSTAEASRLTGFDIPSDSAGVAHRGKIYLIADNITSKLDAERTFFHEAFHVGIRTKYAAATQGYENALRGIAMKNPNIRKAAGEWSLSFGKDAVDMRISYGMTPENAKAQVKLLAIEEALADMSGAVSDRINGLDTLLAAIQKLMRAMGLNTLADYFEGLSNAEALAMIADARKSTVARTESAMQPAMSRDRVYNNSREDLSNFNRYDAANDKPSQALRDAIKKFERETPGFQIDPLGNSRVIVTRLKKDDLVSSLKTLKEFGDTNNVAVGISSKTASYTDFSESSGFRAYIQRADDEIGGRVSYERDSNHFARIVGVYAPRSLKGEVRFSRKPSVNTLLKKYGYAPKYDFEVVRALNAGDRIFAFNEQDEKPIEITSVTSKEGIDEYPLDRLLILDKMAGVPDAPVLSRAPQTDTPAFRKVDVFGNGSRVQYFDDAKDLYYESQKYPAGMTKWRAGEVIDGQTVELHRNLTHQLH